LSLTVFTQKKTLQQTFFKQRAILHGKRPFCAFERLWATYDDHLELIGKRVVDFRSVLIELFSLGFTIEALRANIGSKLGPADHNFQVEGVAPTSHSSSQKTGLNVLSYGIKIWTDLS